MLKRISVTMVFTMAVIVVAMFAVTQVMAQDIEDTCTNFNIVLEKTRVNRLGGLVDLDQARFSWGCCMSR